MTLSRRIRTALALPREERSLALRAIADLLIAPFLVRLLGLARLRSIVESTPVVASRGAEHARAVQRALARAERAVPWATCWPRALVAARMLRRAGLPAEIVIGVEGSGSGAKGGAFRAHAWVRSGDLVVVGDGDLSRYAELARFGAPR